MERRTYQPRLDQLEDREVPATFGIPWADPLHLTLSFTPDGTAIAGQTHSQLFQALNAQRSASVWQRDVLRAIQTWAAVANVNVGVVPDSGAPFGTPAAPGLAPFGDLRVGAQPMAATALAVGVPPDPFFSGTWAGDVFLNSATSLYTANTDLFSIALHEVGHALGLPNSTDPTSVMYGQAIRARTGLSASDVTAIRALYGARLPDANEGSKTNNTFKEATRLKFPSLGGENDVGPSYDGATPLVGYGDITTARDVDIFWVRGLEGYSGPLTVRLLTQGVSLLAPKLSVYNEAGQLIGQAQGTTATGSDLIIQLPPLGSETRYYLKVEAATADAFAIGRYALAVSFDGRNATPAANLDAVMRGAYDGLDENDLARLLADPAGAVLNDDLATNEGPLTATRLKGPAGATDPVAFHTIGSLATPADVDYYAFTAPRSAAGTRPALTVTVQEDPANGLLPRIVVLDANQAVLPAEVLANGNGTYSVCVTNARPGATYFVKVLAPAGGLTAPGNYRFDARFTATAPALTDFSQGTLTAAGQAPLYVAQTQLFHLLLTATGPAGTGVRMTITSVTTGETVVDLTAQAGETVSGNQTLLTPGEYAVRYEPVGTVAAPVSFRIRGAVDSDPIGPVQADPRLRPQYTTPTPGVFQFPTGTTTTRPYQWVGLVV